MDSVVQVNWSITPIKSKYNISNVVILHLEINSIAFLLKFTLISILISDINECNHGVDPTDTDDCHDNATCTDSEGSYTCACNLGYTGDGFNCTGRFMRSIEDLECCLFDKCKSRELSWVHSFLTDVHIG